MKPPTADTSAKMVAHMTARRGEEVICTAAAPGVISSAMTSSEPTICTDCAAARPTSTAKATEMKRVGTPAAWAITGSAEAKSMGRHRMATAERMTTVVAAKSHTEAEDTPTIWPVSSVIAVFALPG